MEIGSNKEILYTRKSVSWNSNGLLFQQHHNSYPLSIKNLNKKLNKFSTCFYKIRNYKNQLKMSKNTAKEFKMTDKGK